MFKSRILAATGAAAVLAVSACADDSNTPDSAVALGPMFAKPPAVCDTRDLSAAARGFFPQEFRRQARDLITALGDACLLDAGDEATTRAYDILALMEEAQGAVTILDPSAGADLATGLLPFMSFDPTDCDPAGCEPAGFAEDILLALSTRGAFAVRGGPDDPTGDVVARDAVDPQTESDPAVWGLSPSSTWELVLGSGQRALLYGHPEALAGGCDAASADCPATDEEFSWQTLPDLDGFGDQMIVGACLQVADGISEDFLRMRRNTTALEKADFNACTAFLPGAGTASLGERLLQFLSPRPQSLFAVARKTGPGGLAGDFSDFTPLSTTSEATLEIEAIPDATVGATIGPIRVTAYTANGTPLERVQVQIAPEDNNGSWTVDYLPGGTDTCGDDCRFTEEEGGTAVFTGLTLDKTGGYRICASVKEGGDLGFTFPEKVCSNGFNVRPN